MPRKWKVQVVSQNRSNKARSNWRSLYSLASWFNKAWKKIWNLASLMMFLMSGDNISYMPFNIWRLPQLLRFYKTKFSQSLRCPQNTMSQNTHSKISTNKKIPCPKNLMPKNSMSNKKILCKKSHVQHQQTKKSNKNPMSNKKSYAKKKIFSMSNKKFHV